MSPVYMALGMISHPAQQPPQSFTVLLCLPISGLCHRVLKSSLTALPTTVLWMRQIGISPLGKMRMWLLSSTQGGFGVCFPVDKAITHSL